MEVLKHPVKIRNPYDKDEDNQAVQDRFDLSLHGDESVHNPQQKPCCNNRNDDGSKRHITFSNSFSWLRYRLRVHRREGFLAMSSLSRWDIRKRRTITPLHFLFFQVASEIAEQ
jgi:hypothetical protein